MADRDGGDPDHPPARGDAPEARIGDPALPRDRRRRVRPTGRLRAPGRRRIPRPEAPVAVDRPDDLG